MTFATEGFFSKEVDGFREYVRTQEPFNKWFDYAKSLVRLGLEMLEPIETDLRDERLLLLNTAFVRVHQALQSELVLAERGLVLDARVVIRSGVESAIAINALAKQSGFVESLKDAHYRSRRTLARAIKLHFAGDYTAEQLANFDKEIAEADRVEAAKGFDDKGRKIELTDIKWEQVAQAHAHELYQLLYRSMSGDGTHATLDAWQRFLLVDEGGRITGLEVGPQREGLQEALSGVTLMFVWAADPFATSNGLTWATEAIQAKVQEFGTLPGAFPSTV